MQKVSASKGAAVLASSMIDLPGTVTSSCKLMLMYEPAAWIQHSVRMSPLYTQNTSVRQESRESGTGNSKTAAQLSLLPIAA